MNRIQRNRSSRKQRLDFAGLAIIASMGLGVLTFGYAAVQIDAANGITPAESMCNNGFSGFCAAAPREAPAVPVKLVGLCDGRMMAALEESAFPAGCDWIAPLGGVEQ